MLVLTRKRGQKVCIGDGIVVTVVEVKGNQVRLGFNAPPGIPIDREEILAKKRHSFTDPKHQTEKESD